MALGKFTDIGAAKRVARLTNEVPNDDVEEFVETVNQQMIAEHSFPPGRIYSYVDSDRGSYYTNRRYKPEYAIERVYIDGSLLPESSWTGKPGSALVILQEGVASNHDSETIHIDFIPRIYHDIATFRAAKDLLESQYIISTEGGEFPRTAWLSKREKELQDQIPDGPMLRTSPYDKWDPNTGEYVSQYSLGEEL